MDSIKARCLECGDCWKWQGITSKSGVPKINIFVGRGKNGRTVLSARRVVWELVKGPIPPKKLLTTNCGCVTCLNPDHLVLTTKSKVSQKNGARLDVKLKRAISNARNRRRAKLTLDQVLVIRVSEERTRLLADRFGVGIAAINRIRSGRSWKDYSNPFAGLGA